MPVRFIKPPAHIQDRHRIAGLDHASQFRGGDQDLTTGLHRSPPCCLPTRLIPLSRNQCSYGQVTCTPNGSSRMPVWPGITA
ncbi:Uncharacterised protein [Mycobacterium tuberculosis]|uniref:Uncharacterized protein n=1 Tax=Mycobacterium tuberculosis TaxID=1773 RepID=A0A0U0QSD5_MYCTX|nr:Uncharacterised protein [Mycobacterium tuberculosis]COZ17783.1 Uncharacterised protein [Mycobacterium tuberculosis]